MKAMLTILAAFALAFGLNGIAEAAKFPAFSTKDLKGAGVTEAVFAESKVTMINFWATWCPPCVAEMPDLGQLARDLPEGAALVGVLMDAQDGGAIMRAGQILEKADADFLQLQPSAEMSAIFRDVQAIPTSIFVDSRGNIVGKPIVGANVKEVYRDAMIQALEAAAR